MRPADAVSRNRKSFTVRFGIPVTEYVTESPVWKSGSKVKSISNFPPPPVTLYESFADLTEPETPPTELVSVKIRFIASNVGFKLKQIELIEFPFNARASMVRLT